MEPQLEDFFEYYPAQDDPEIQKKIANYHEFQECFSGREDVKIEGDTFYTHQRAYQRLGHVVDRIMLIAEAGVGKTRCNICLADYLRQNKQARKNYFITGASQIDDYNRQLVSALSEVSEKAAASDIQSAATTQIGELSGRYQGEAGVYTKKLGKLLSDFNQVMTYEAFAKKVLALVTKVIEETPSKDTDFGVLPAQAIAESNRRIDEEFAGCSFFFDEIQFMKITTDNTAKKEGKARERHVFYWAIWRVCQVVTRARITIASARPLTNEPEEFGYALNWILPLDQQVPLNLKFQEEGARNAGLEASYGKRIDWKSLSRNSTSRDLARATEYYMKAFEPYLRGRVMFIAAAYTGVNPSYLPLSEPLAPPAVRDQIEAERAKQLEKMKKAKTLTEKAQANLRLLPMKLRDDGSFDIQAQTYADYINYKGKRGKSEGLKYKNPTEILTVVFPKIRGREHEKNWGIEAMNSWVTENNTYREGVVSAENGKDLRWYLRKHLDSLSISMAYIRNTAVNFPWKGYVFTDIVKGGGVYLLGLALEEVSRVFIRKKWYNKPFARYVPQEFNAELVPRGQLKTKFSKAPRYAIISAESTSSSPMAMAKILALYNHPDNIHGEYMKYIIISRKGMTGINLMHVMHIFSLFMSHNPSDQYQAIRRAIRATSHQELRKLWMKSEVYRNYPFEVSINLLIPIFAGGEYPTAAVSIFGRTLLKDLNIAPVMRTYKQLSVMAWIFRDRNNLERKQAGTADADYMSATLTIPSDEPDDIIYTNYLLLYAGEKIERAALAILKVLRRDNEYDIRKHIDQYEDQLELSIFQLAIASLLVVNDYDLTDAFGFKCDIVLFDSILYLERRYSTVPQRELCSYYTSSLIAVESKSLTEIIDETIKLKINSVYDEILAIGNDLEALTDYISRMKIEQKALFLESIIARVNSDDPQFTPELRDILDTILVLLNIDLEQPEKPGNYFHMDEPVEAIQRINAESVAPDEKSYVYVHNVYVYVRGSSGAGKISRTSGAVGRLRIFRLAERKWRDTRDDETEVYRKIFEQLNIDRERKIQEKSKIYGRVSEGDSKFWIVDKYLENKFAGGNEIHEGTATLARKIYAVAYMWHFGYTYDVHSLRDQHPELFVNLRFQLRPEDLEKSAAYERSLGAPERRNLELLSNIKYGIETQLLRDAENTYAGKYPRPVIVHAVREKMISYAIERAREQLWTEVDDRIGKKVNQTFMLRGAQYSFDPALRMTHEGPFRATPEMVAFFYHYLSSQSSSHGYPKPKLIKLIALRMHEQGLVFSDTLSRSAVRRIVEELNTKN